MRRTKLLWFALGAGTAGLVSVAFLLISRPLVFDDTTTAYLILTEPTDATDGSASKGNERFMAYRTGRLLKECGARAFETTALWEDHLPTAEFPIIFENYQSIECVVASIRDNDLPFKVEMRWSSAVTDEMRSEN